MMCSLCGGREAVIFMRRSNAGENAELALCPDCARARGISAGQGRIELRFEELLESRDEEKDVAACPSCGLEFERFRREARLGCAACATAFRNELSRRLLASASLPAPQTRRGSSRSVPQIELYTALARALRTENYEEAARLRDSLPPDSRTPPLPGLFPGEGDAPPPAAETAILRTRARLERNFADRPFPGSPRGSTAASREEAAALVSSLLGLEVFALSGLDEGRRRALVESGVFSRSFAAAEDSLAARDPSLALFCRFDEGNHFSFRLELPGLGALRAEELLLGLDQRLLAGYEPAYDPEFGYLTSSIEDCGTGFAVSCLLHVPALERLGLLERLLKSVLAEGYELSGSYGQGGGSAGELYELSISRESVAVAAVAAGVEGLEAAARTLAQAEMRARLELVSRDREAVLDRLGRALGTARYARRVSESEGVALLSELRFGALAGLLGGLDPVELGRLMDRMGPASLCLEAEERGLVLPGEDEKGPLKYRASSARAGSFRAGLLRSLCAAAQILEGGQ